MNKIIVLAIAVMLSAAGSVAYGQQPENKGKGKSNQEKVEKGKPDSQAKEKKGRPDQAGAESRVKAEQPGKSGEMKAREGQETGARIQETARQKNEQQEAQMKDTEHRAGEMQGNAYGKNKGDLEGREFGQARAAQARAMNQRMEQTNRELDETGRKLDETRRKLDEAREKLEVKREAGEVSQEEYDETIEAIEEVETRTREVESARAEQERRIREIREQPVGEGEELTSPATDSAREELDRQRESRTRESTEAGPE